jgi:hypothetical protein
MVISIVSLAESLTTTVLLMYQQLVKIDLMEKTIHQCNGLRPSSFLAELPRFENSRNVEMTSQVNLLEE